jgi:hypothetical protein
MIYELAVFEKLEHMVVATPAMLHDSLFCDKPVCEALVGETEGEVVTFALFFHNFSTFLCKKGLYLEDLYVSKPAVARATASRCWWRWPNWRWSAIAAASNGRCWTGMPTPSSSTKAWAPT